MSLSFRDAAPLGSPRLQYRTLLAVLRREDAGDAVEPCPKEIHLNARSANLHLAAILSGHAGWRESARALGGRFAAPATAAREA